MRAHTWLAVALTLLGAGCQKSAPAPSTRASGPGESVSAVRYALAVEATTRAGSADKRTLSLRTNRGYQVTLTRAQLSSYGAALVPCLLRPPAPRGASLLRELLLPRARAGHTDQRDPSYVAEPALEDLRIPGERALGTRSFPAARYCRVHYLAAAPDGEGAADSGEPPLTLLLEGSARDANGVVTQVHVRSALAHGRTIDLPAALGPSPSEESTLEVTFTRSLDGLLDDLELASADAKEIERGALRNLVSQMKVGVRWR